VSPTAGTATNAAMAVSGAIVLRQRFGPTIPLTSGPGETCAYTRVSPASAQPSRSGSRP
jgi:hypothetical protein